MGIFDRFITNTAPVSSVDVAAANTPYNLQQSVGGLFYGAQTATREQAMSVPALSRARNIICSTIGSLPLETYNYFTNQHLEPLRVIKQPDPRIAGSAIYAWVAEDLLFRGVIEILLKILRKLLTGLVDFPHKLKHLKGLQFRME